LQQQGGGVAVSFGGALGDELSSVCTDPAKLAAAYESVISRYKVTTIDLDVESANLGNPAADQRRAAALKTVQDAHRARGADLAIWLTLPASTTGLSADGASLVGQLLGAGVDLAGVNAMTMDFGETIDPGESMASASERALDSTHRQLAALYKRAGLTLTEATLWSKIGATPMLGQNDDPGQIFGLDDARQLNAYALSHHIGRMSVWSLNRDTACGSNYVNLARVSDACSGVAQGDVRFADVLSAGFTGSAIRAASAVTTAESIDPASVTDNPATSPYPIWSLNSSYLKGTKVVWHHNVYEAKWWTRGALPDDPVLNAWETPWTLIGPVLAGETPIPVPTVAPGTYPDWSGTSIYDKGNRVLFAGVPYEAKWWNQGESPEAYSTSPDSSPWVPLTEDEIAALPVSAG
jgi:chitinase